MHIGGDNQNRTGVMLSYEDSALPSKLYLHLAEESGFEPELRQSKCRDLPISRFPSIKNKKGEPYLGSPYSSSVNKD